MSDYVFKNYSLKDIAEDPNYECNKNILKYYKEEVKKLEYFINNKVECKELIDFYNSHFEGGINENIKQYKQYVINTEEKIKKYEYYIELYNKEKEIMKKII